MSPTIFILKNKVRISFYSNEHNPIHVHIRAPEREAKIEVETGKVISNKGFSSKDIKLLKKFILERKNFIKETWNEYFK